VNQRNPVASALMANMQMVTTEHPQVILTLLQLLTDFGLNPTPVQLI
jgi:hypothetical protein